MLIAAADTAAAGIAAAGIAAAGIAAADTAADGIAAADTAAAGIAAADIVAVDIVAVDIVAVDIVAAVEQAEMEFRLPWAVRELPLQAADIQTPVVCPKTDYIPAKAIELCFLLLFPVKYRWFLQNPQESD